MKNNLPNLVCMVLAMFILSCKSAEKRNIHLYNISYDTAFSAAQTEGKGIFFISKADGCPACEVYETALLRDQEFAAAIYKDYIVASINHMQPGNEWLSRLINATATPVFIITDKNGEIRAIISGAVPKKKITDILTAVSTGKHLFEHYALSDTSHISAPRQMACVQATLNAQLEWDRYEKNKQYTADKMPTYLKESISIYPYFYNNYLLARYYSTIRDTANARIYAHQALEFHDAKSAGMFHMLRREMHLIIDPEYSPEKEPLAVPDSVERSLGLVQEGSIRKIRFKISNSGKQTLIFGKTYTDCPCTLAKTLQDSIAPGKDGELEVTFSATETGSFSHAVFIHSNAANPMLKLMVKGIIP
ncbi:DUF1573 domain-containing protein [Chitinophaga sp. Mgbs1]|uniref:DUF1573 domain-containing protein n=1 Tax=Chitinophaga solisilvae TaxID=1233460 RepID=A0A9Q5GS31_9BACT|nr:DUF1573 domain-containing protein [Chitinophaga solisilvae]